MRDRDVRAALLDEIHQHFSHDESIRVFSELGVSSGRSRIDIAIVNGALHGIEIKSERDTLERLPAQIKAYSKVFDTITLVVGENHLAHAQVLVPDWWGIRIARYSDSIMAFEEVRAATQNVQQDGYALAELLWREEALCLLENHDLATGMYYKPRKAIWQKIANEISLRDLLEFVKITLKTRADWRPDSQLVSNGDQCQFVSKPSDYQD